MTVCWVSHPPCLVYHSDESATCIPFRRVSFWQTAKCTLIWWVTTRIPFERVSHPRALPTIPTSHPPVCLACHSHLELLEKSHKFKAFRPHAIVDLLPILKFIFITRVLCTNRTYNWSKSSLRFGFLFQTYTSLHHNSVSCISWMSNVVSHFKTIRHAWWLRTFLFSVHSHREPLQFLELLEKSHKFP